MTTYANEIANTIYAQLGGRRFMVFTGSKIDGVKEEGANVTLTFRLARNASSANRLSITYNAGMDLYDVDFYRETFSRKTFETTRKSIKKVDGAYCDMLVDLFENTTGLYTHF